RNPAILSLYGATGRGKRRRCTCFTRRRKKKDTTSTSLIRRRRCLKLQKLWFNSRKIMAILVNKQTRVLIQGITGKEGMRALSNMQRYGTRVLAGVRPGQAGQKAE